MKKEYSSPVFDFVYLVFSDTQLASSGVEDLSTDTDTEIGEWGDVDL